MGRLRTAGNANISTHPPSAATPFAWQGWRLDLPSTWNPVKLEGDYDAGFALIADIDRPQLGLRWRAVRAGKRFDAQRWARRAMRDEVGKLAADEARPHPLERGAGPGSLIYIEPDPPGRDVFVAHSGVSGRAIEIVRHIQRRERTLHDEILPTLIDAPADEPRRWAVFDLACIVPSRFRLVHHRLNAGDLTLSFEAGRETLTVRQVALAGLALSRLPIERWLTNQERAVSQRYKPLGEPEAAEAIGSLAGVRRPSVRRRRFALARWLPARTMTYALHDAARDRLLLLQGSNEASIREVAATVGG
jgi:hypothetical protein